LHDVIDFLLGPLLSERLRVEVRWRLWGPCWVQRSVFVLLLKTNHLLLKRLLNVSILRLTVNVVHLYGVAHEVVHFVVHDVIAVETDQFVSFSSHSVLLSNRVPSWVLVVVVVDGVSPSLVCCSLVHQRKERGALNGVWDVDIS